MTCIVALKDPETRTVIMGGDSLRSMSQKGGPFALHMTLPLEAGKVYKFQGFVVGHTGAGRIRHITSRLDVRFGDSGPTKDFDLELVLLSVIIPQIKQIARKDDFLQQKDGLIDLGGQVLIAFGNQICVISGDLSVTPVTYNFWSVGCGDHLSLGSLATTEGSGTSSEERVIKALDIAANFHVLVGPPYLLKRTDPLPLE